MNIRIMLLLLLVAVVSAGFLVDPGLQDKGKKSTASKAAVARGKYLVDFGGCQDCHTPKVMTQKGPVFDTTRMLSGQPANDPIPDVPHDVLGPGKWAGITNMHLSAWAGPWGVSFAKNLTPDKTTGLGTWTEEMFIKAMRNGKDMGEGRDILPPMPWQSLSGLTDEDLKAIFAYLQSIDPIQNAVPEPIPPGAPHGEGK